MAKPLRVLMIEDSEEDAELLLRLLRKGGYEVTHQRIDSAPSLLDSLSSAVWDITISDYSMPGFSGTAALAIIREKRPDLPFIFLSGTMGEETAVSAMRMGAQDYIVKDHTARLLPAVRRELEQAAMRSEHKQVELRMRQLEKFEALGKLAGGVAHDFNNVIGAIMGWTELGIRDAPPRTQALESFRQIGQQALRAASLTRQLFTYARQQALERSVIDLNRLVNQSAASLQQLLGNEIHVAFHLASDLHFVRADMGQIDRVLTNLCVNARDAMPNGGTLAIGTQNVYLGKGNPSLPEESHPGHYVALSVSDSGTGMDARTVEHIFEPFFTTKDVGKGTGLGLATTLGIVKQHDGFIEVKSQPNQGSQFHIFLPAVSGEARPEAARAETAAPGGSETILVAEDHDGIRGMACEVLRSQGYRVLCARDGEEAVRLFEENRDAVSLVFLDILMPKLRGPEAYDEICRRKPGIPVIFTSGHLEESAAVASREAVVILKPYPPKTLLNKVRAVLDTSRR